MIQHPQLAPDYVLHYACTSRAKIVHPTGSRQWATYAFVQIGNDEGRNEVKRKCCHIWRDPRIWGLGPCHLKGKVTTRSLVGAVLGPSTFGHVSSPA